MESEVSSWSFRSEKWWMHQLFQPWAHPPRPETFSTQSDVLLVIDQPQHWDHRPHVVTLLQVSSTSFDVSDRWDRQGSEIWSLKRVVLLLNLKHLSQKKTKKPATANVLVDGHRPAFDVRKKVIHLGTPLYRINFKDQMSICGTWSMC